MEPSANWEQETEAFQRETESESAAKKEQIAALQHEVEELDELSKSLETALSGWRAKHGSGEPKLQPPTLPIHPLPKAATPAALIGERTVPELLLEWARSHDGKVIMREAIAHFVKIKRYEKRAKASDGLYGTIRRMREFQWTATGEYSLISDQSETPQP